MWRYVKEILVIVDQYGRKNIKHIKNMKSKVPSMFWNCVKATNYPSHSKLQTCLRFEREKGEITWINFKHFQSIVEQYVCIKGLIAIYKKLPHKEHLQSHLLFIDFPQLFNIHQRFWLFAIVYTHTQILIE